MSSPQSLFLPVPPNSPQHQAFPVIPEIQSRPASPPHKVSLLGPAESRNSKSPERPSLEQMQTAYEKELSRKAQQHQYYLQRKQKIKRCEELEKTVAQLQQLVLDQQRRIEQLQGFSQR